MSVNRLLYPRYHQFTQLLQQKLPKVLSTGALAFLGAFLAILLVNPMAIALEKITLVLPVPLGTISINLVDLDTLVNTNQPPNSLKSLLDQAQVKPEAFRQVLTQELDLNKFGVNFTTLDRFLNSPIGEIVLDQINQYVYTPTRAGDVKSLRSAFILSVADDSKVTLIEFLRRFGPKEMQINVIPLIGFYDKLTGGQGGDLQVVFSQMRSTLQELVCNAPRA
ncbi:MAG: alpha/beta hydrolase [Synechococcales cyanobacterium]